MWATRKLLLEQQILVSVALLVITGMVRRLNLFGGIRSEQEVSHGDSHDWHRSWEDGLSSCWA